MYLSYTEMCSVMLTGSCLLPTTKRKRMVCRAAQPVWGRGCRVPVTEVTLPCHSICFGLQRSYLPWGIVKTQLYSAWASPKEPRSVSVTGDWWSMAGSGHVVHCHWVICWCAFFKRGLSANVASVFKSEGGFEEAGAQERKQSCWGNKPSISLALFSRQQHGIDSPWACESQTLLKRFPIRFSWKWYESKFDSEPLILTTALDAESVPSLK